MDIKKGILISKIKDSPVFIHTMAGVLLGFCVLHPVTMVVYWFDINNTKVTLQSISEALCGGITRTFHPDMLLMSLVFMIIGGVAGLGPGIYFRRIGKQEREIIKQQGQLNESLAKLGKLNQSLEEKVAELKRSNNEKDIFFSIIAHDIRNPFNGFLGLTQMMADELSELTSEEIQMIARSMQDSATNLAGLLDNLLKWARVQQGLIPFDPGTIELRSFMEESLKAELEHAKNKGLKSTFIVPNDLTAFADSNMLQFVLRNLISNAVKFTRNGGEIKISARANDDNSVEFSIKDTGIGMNSTMVDHLFRLDNQTNRKGTEGEPSSGLGLTLCKEFVEKLGGKIWVKSEVGKGSVFYFTVPHFN